MAAPVATAAARLEIDVWSDYVCPFCWLEVPVLERVLAGHGGRVTVRWRAFELRPAPVPTLPPAGDYLRRTWAESVYPMAERRGMVLRLPPVQPRSRRAHEAAVFARAHGRFDALHTALFRAFFEQGRDIGELGVLLDVAEDVGLDAAALGERLHEARDADEVVADQRLAHELGVTGVPAMVVRPAGAGWDRAVLVSGAVPDERLEAAIAHVAAAPAG